MAHDVRKFIVLRIAWHRSVRLLVTLHPQTGHRGPQSGCCNEQVSLNMMMASSSSYMVEFSSATVPNLRPRPPPIREELDRHGSKKWLESQVRV